MLRKSLLSIALFTIAIPALGLDFFREDIEFEIVSDTFKVDGIYYFHNDSSQPINRVLFYPIPIDSLYEEATEIKAVNLADSSDCLVKIQENGFFFSVRLQPYQKGKLQLGYTQKLEGNKAEYILTSTQNWGRSLQEVNYKIEIPESIKIESISYLPDSLETKQDKHIFYYHRKDFMPDENMIIRFEKVMFLLRNGIEICCLR